VGRRLSHVWPNPGVSVSSDMLEAVTSIRHHSHESMVPRTSLNLVFVTRHTKHHCK
jgi:hypothetical protein